MLVSTDARETSARTLASGRALVGAFHARARGVVELNGREQQSNAIAQFGDVFAVEISEHGVAERLEPSRIVYRPGADSEPNEIVLVLSQASDLGIRQRVDCCLGLEEIVKALYCIYYNFDQTLRVTPAMEAGIADYVWSVDEIVALLDA